MNPSDPAKHLYNFHIGGRRTSMRLEGAFSDALSAIAEAEETSRSAIVERAVRAGASAGLDQTASVRVFVLTHFIRMSNQGALPLAFTRPAMEASTDAVL